MNRRLIPVLGLCGATVAALTIGLLLRRSGPPAPAGNANAPALATEAPESAPPAAPAPTVPAAARPRPPAPPPAEASAPEPVEAAPEFGTLRIEADVPGAQVFLDRQFVGMAPVTIDELAPGTHQLHVNAEGFDGVARTIDVQPGRREISINLRQVRLEASLPVVHRHRFGSCTGDLVATPDGIRYETTNREDGFTVALGDLEAFQVDYQDRNLKVKVRRGREYNFTDPEGNADRLFVFHRDVERARERLAKQGQR